MPFLSANWIFKTSIFYLIFMNSLIWIFFSFILFCLNRSLIRLKWDKLIFVMLFSFWTIFHFWWSVHVAFPFNSCTFRWSFNWFKRLFLLFFMFTARKAYSWLGLIDFLLCFLFSKLLNSFLPFFLHLLNFLSFHFFKIVGIIHFDLKSIIFGHFRCSHRLRFLHCQENPPIFLFLNFLLDLLFLMFRLFRFILLRNIRPFEMWWVKIWHIFFEKRWIVRIVKAFWLHNLFLNFFLFLIFGFILFWVFFGLNCSLIKIGKVFICIFSYSTFWAIHLAFFFDLFLLFRLNRIVIGDLIFESSVSFLHIESHLFKLGLLFCLFLIFFEIIPRNGIGCTFDVGLNWYMINIQRGDIILRRYILSEWVTWSGLACWRLSFWRRVLFLFVSIVHYLKHHILFQLLLLK